MVVDGEKVEYTGTIRALAGAPIGQCSGTASNVGIHPFTCSACNALVQGKTSTLKRKLIRNSKLKYPRSDLYRATKSGVNHKFCSREHLQNALQVRKAGEKVKSLKVATLSSTCHKLLHDKWHRSVSAKPFVETLISLFEEKKLSDFDTSFLKNWLGKKAKGKYYHADEQARSLAVLYSNKLGEKMYTTTAPLLGLPTVRQARRIRAHESSECHYLPGLNDWVFEKVSKRENTKPLQNGMDGTRIIRTIELYRDKYLVGKQFPPDVRLWPSATDLMQSTTMQEVQDYILQVRCEHAYAAEAYSFNLSDTTGEFADILAGSIPEAKSGITGAHILAEMLAVEKHAEKYMLPLIGHCTDSAANSLSALIKVASPVTYQIPTLPQLTFLGLPKKDFVFFAPFLRSKYPTIAYPCCDHSARTVVRNLMNKNITIVCGKLPSDGSGIQHYQVASIDDLFTLKHNHANSTIRYADISRHIKQNCDATSRVLTSKAIEELSVHVPDSKGTQLYIQAAVWTHEPFRNAAFGPPPKVVQSLWAGITTWRRWRRYVQITSGITLSSNFISRSHYITEELLVHAGINHQLSLYYAFPHLSLADYSMRHTGNRGLEAIHGMFRGGTCSLPITSPNLSFLIENEPDPSNLQC